MNNCNSICRNYKTEKGYLCDKEEFSNLGGKSWCKIDTSDVNNYNKYLSEPYSKSNLMGRFFWDYTTEKKRQKICLDDRNSITYNSCSILENFKYYLSIIIIRTLTPVVIGLSIINYQGREHLKQTLNLATATNKQILIFIIGNLRELAQTELVNNGIISQEDLNDSIKTLKDQVNEIDVNNKAEYGAYLKDILRTGSSIIKTNEKFQSSLGPASVMDFFVETIPDEYAMEVIKGGNFVRADNGDMYNWTKTKLNGYGRFSSHQSSEIQYGYTDMFIDSYLHMLCGVVKYTDKPSISWCQFEGAPMPPGLTNTQVAKSIFGKNIFSGVINFNKKNLQEYVDHFVDSEIYFVMSKLPIYLTSKLKGIISSLPENIQSKLPEVPKLKGFNLALGTSPHTDDNPIYMIPLNLQELNSIPKQTPTFNFLRNYFTYQLGIHTDLVPMSKNETISPLEYQQTKQLQDYGNLNISQGMNANNSYIPTQISQLPTYQLQSVSMGGKYKKKTKKNRTKKRRSIKKTYKVKSKKSRRYKN